MNHISEEEKLFHNEVREKKKAASGVHSKTGKKGYVGRMRFPSDILNRTEKKRYKGTSKVTISNMYQQILPIEDFEKLEEYEKKNMLQYWRNTYQNIKILKEMGISNKRFYDIVAELELPAAKRIYKKKRKASTKQAKKDDEVFEAIQPVEVIVPKEMTEDPDGLHLVFKGTYKPKTIVRNLMNFIGMLEDEEDENEDFHVEIKITHKAAQK